MQCASCHRQRQRWRMAIPGRLELPTYGLGNRRSIRLSYGTTAHATSAKADAFLSDRPAFHQSGQKGARSIVMWDVLSHGG